MKKQLAGCITPQKLVYNSWLKTGNPVEYCTQDKDGNTINNPAIFRNPIEDENYNPEYSGICNMCGQEIHGGIPHKKLLGSTYLDWAIHKEPEATHICKYCAFCLMLNPAEKRTSLKKYSFVADGNNLYLCNRKQIRDFLINPPKPPFVMACAVSQKKHLIGKTKISYQKDMFFCNLEEQSILVPRQEIQAIIPQVEALRAFGITKGEIETGKLAQAKYTKLGFDNCNKIIAIIKEIKGSSILELACFVAQKMEEEKATCLLGLEPKTK